MDQLELFAVGLAAGGLGSLLGVGGGVILVPGFTLVAGLPLRDAVGASLVCVVATSVAGSITHLRQQRIQLSLAFELQFFTVIGAVSAGLVAVFVPARPLHFAFALLLVYVASQMWTSARRSRQDLFQRENRKRRGLAAGGSLAGGVIAGLLGVGGGIAFMPVLHLVLRRPFSHAAATSIYMIGITAASGALVYLARGDVVPGVAAIAMLGALIGSGSAALVGQRVDSRTVKVGFALLLLLTAVQMVRRGLIQP